MTNDALAPANGAGPPQAVPRLSVQIRNAIRLRHYALRTERTYLHWIGRYIRFHGGHRHPRALGPQPVTAFLSSLATERNVSASTQNQALAALLFLYREVLGVDLPWLHEISRAKRPRRLPVVLSQQEAGALLGRMGGVHALMAKLMYGTGMRLMECLRLRVKDMDLVRREIVVRQGKGAKDRITMFPVTLIEPMRAHLEQVRRIYDGDRAAQVPGVELPYALALKKPGAATSWGWNWVFPQD